MKVAKKPWFARLTLNWGAGGGSHPGTTFFKAFKHEGIAGGSDQNEDRFKIEKNLKIISWV